MPLQRTRPIACSRNRPLVALAVVEGIDEFEVTVPSAHVRPIASDVVPNPTRKRPHSRRAGAWERRTMTAPPPALGTLDGDALRYHRITAPC